MLLAIGISDSCSGCWSIATNDIDPFKIIGQLVNGGQYPEEVLLVVNGPDSPSVIGHYFISDIFHSDDTLNVDFVGSFIEQVKKRLIEGKIRSNHT